MASYTICLCNNMLLFFLVGGWATPLKNMSQFCQFIPIYGKIKNGNQTKNQLTNRTIDCTIAFFNSDCDRSSFVPYCTYIGRHLSEVNPYVGHWIVGVPALPTSFFQHLSAFVNSYHIS